jgi:uncharacterized membrane protein HdeD (DUF308 family)
VWPTPDLEVSVYVFAALAFIDGIATLTARGQGGVLAGRRAWAKGLSGVLGVVFAVAMLLWPGMTTLTLLYLVASWSIATGAREVVTAIELQRVVDGEIWITLSGLLLVGFGLLLLGFRGTGLASLVGGAGFYAILLGTASLGLATRLYRIDRELQWAIRTHPSAGIALVLAHN